MKKAGLIIFAFTLIFILLSCSQNNVKDGADTSLTDEITRINGPDFNDITNQESNETEKQITEAKTKPEKETETEKETEKETTNKKIAAVISNMTAEEKIAQMFLVRCPQTKAAAVADRYKFGGFVMFASNFENKTADDIKNEIDIIQAASKIPMLIGVDEEGGTVTRISRYTAFRASPFLSPRELFASGGYNLIKSDTEEKSKLLLSLGINLNLAPVCDISGSKNDFIYYRSFGGDHTDVSQYVKYVVTIMAKNKIGSTLKHFPGYGSNDDTHTSIVIDTREYSVFETSDFLPFAAGIEAGAGSVMISHNIMECIDPDRPASVSSAVHELLRGTLNFNGVIITDDLGMDGITNFTDGAEAAVAAVLAGNDMLCCSDYETQYKAVVSAYENKLITEERINQSVERILKWKIDLNIIF